MCKAFLKLRKLACGVLHKLDKIWQARGDATLRDLTSHDLDKKQFLPKLMIEKVRYLRITAMYFVRNI